MIYPKTFEHKIGFDEIRTLLRERCLSTLGKEKIDDMSVSTNPTIINEWLQQVKEFRLLQEQADDFPMQFFFDVRESVARLRLEGTHLNEDELFDLKRSLETIYNIVNYLNRLVVSAFRPEYDYAAATYAQIFLSFPSGRVALQSGVSYPLDSGVRF